MTELIALDNTDEFNSKAANILEHSIDKLLLKQEKAVFGIPGGRSIAGIFKKLKEKDILWKKVHIFMVDERLVPVDDPQSNFRTAKENFIDELLNKGLLPKDNIHPFIGDISKYEDELKELGGIYDIVLLSSGEDGHIAALYPNHHSIKDNSDYFITMNDSPKPPKDRMTLAPNLVLKSKSAILLFLGKKKEEAYKKFIDKNINTNECPAKLILSIENSYVLTNFND